MLANATHEAARDQIGHLEFSPSPLTAGFFSPGEKQVTAQNALGKAISYLATATNSNATSRKATCRSPTTPPNVQSGPSSSEERAGCSVTRPKARRPALNFTAWWRLPMPTAKSPMRGCATHRNGCRKRTQLKITKPCCHGTARRYRLAERTNHPEVGGVYGALTVIQAAMNAACPCWPS